jgi:hypothetical protein
MTPVVLIYGIVAVLLFVFLVTALWDDGVEIYGAAEVIIRSLAIAACWPGFLFVVVFAMLMGGLFSLLPSGEQPIDRGVPKQNDPPDQKGQK